MHPRDHLSRRRLATILVMVAALLSTLTSPVSAVTDLDGTATVAYTEQEPAKLIASGFTATGGLTYGGGYLEVSIVDQTSEETLALQAVATPDITTGAISVVGSLIHLGNGTSADVIAAIDRVRNGADGNPLRIVFSSEFTNSGFEPDDGGLAGWTVFEDVVDLGVTELAGWPTIDTSTYPANSGGNDDDYPAVPGEYTVVVSDATASEGTSSLRLESGSMTPESDCDVVHGPAVVSGGFDAAAGDSIVFDWRAFSGVDAHHVFGYLVDSAGNQTEVLDTFATTISDTDWTTKETLIPATETYRFVFVSGTYDATCGNAAGAALHIDNVKVFSNRVTDTELQAIGRLLTYHNAADAPPDTRTVSIEANAAVEGTDTTTFTIDITQVPDEPSMHPIPDIVFDNTAAADAFIDVTGTVPFTDPEGEPVTYSLTNAETGNWIIGDIGYDERRIGAYSTVYLHTATGSYRVVAEQGADDTRESASETVEFSGTDLDPGTTLTADLTIKVDVETVPGAPAAGDATGGVDSAEITWDAPTWIGGSTITDYVVEYATTDTGPWTVFADGVSADTSATVTGLTGGKDYRFRISAVNASGTGAPSAPIADTFVVAGYRPGPCLDEDWTRPASDVFDDVGTADFFHDPASWAHHNEIVFGRAPTRLAARDDVTRAEFITMLFRMTCEHETAASLPYDDIEEGAFYVPALRWAHANHIIVGTSPTTFSPQQLATRAHIATILHRLAGNPEPLTDLDLGDLPSDRYFTDAVVWMASTELTRVGDRFEPFRAARRSEAITFLHRLNTNQLYS